MLTADTPCLVRMRTRNPLPHVTGMGLSAVCAEHSSIAASEVLGAKPLHCRSNSLTKAKVASQYVSLSSLENRLTRHGAEGRFCNEMYLKRKQLNWTHVLGMNETGHAGKHTKQKLSRWWARQELQDALRAIRQDAPKEKPPSKLRLVIHLPDMSAKVFRSGNLLHARASEPAVRFFPNSSLDDALQPRKTVLLQHRNFTAEDELTVKLCGEAKTSA